MATGFLVFGWSLAVRGITVGDEGYLLSQALEIAGGRIPYRDLDMFVAPGVWLLLASLFRLFEPSVLLTRIPALLGFGLNAWLGARIARHLVRPAADAEPDSGIPEPTSLAALVCVGLFATMAVWAFPAWTFAYYSPFAMAFASAALLTYLSAVRRGSTLLLLVAGVFVGLSTLFKHNYGAYAAVGLGLAEVLRVARGPEGAGAKVVRILGNGLAILGGLLVVLGPLVYWFAVNDALAAAAELLFVRPFVQFAQHHSIPYLPLADVWEQQEMTRVMGFIYMSDAARQTPYVLSMQPWVITSARFLSGLLYWLPPLVFAVGGAWAWRDMGRKGTTTAAIVLFAGMMFLGVFPRADFTHLMHVYQAVIPLFAGFGVRALVSLRGRTRIALGSVFVLAGLGYVVVGGAWYRHLIREYVEPLDVERGGVLLETLDAEQLEFEVAELVARTQPGEPIAAMTGLSMLNFLAERPLPGPYANYYAVHIGHDRGRSAKEAIERSGVRWVVADYNNFFADPDRMVDFAPVLTDYLARNFDHAYSVNGLSRMVLQRRTEPRPAEAWTELLGFCDTRDSVGAQYQTSHLLFQALYHSPTRSRLSGNGVWTFCRIGEVPPASRLHLEVETTRAWSADPDATFTVEVWAFPDGDAGESMGLLSWKNAFTPPETPASPRSIPFDIDLGPLAGRTVSLALRTRIDGRVEGNPFLLPTPSVLWRSMRIETPWEHTGPTVSSPSDAAAEVDAAPAD